MPLKAWWGCTNGLTIPQSHPPVVHSEKPLYKLRTCPTSDSTIRSCGPFLQPQHWISPKSCERELAHELHSPRLQRSPPTSYQNGKKHDQSSNPLLPLIPPKPPTCAADQNQERWRWATNWHPRTLQPLPTRQPLTSQHVTCHMLTPEV
jgi:hypothetical protein